MKAEELDFLRKKSITELNMLVDNWMLMASHMSTPSLLKQVTSQIRTVEKIIAEKKGTVVYRPNPRVSKTYILYVIQGYYGHGWEDVDASDVRAEAKENLRLYRENEPQYSHRMIRRRTKIGE